MNKPEPIIKWAGGKRQLLERIIERLPKSFNSYYEPFIGGGAVLFGISDKLIDKKVVINDVNEQLINLYSIIKNKPIEFMKTLSSYDNNHNGSKNQKEFYFSMRDKYNDMILNSSNYYDYEIASMMVYINKHCFNGLYRVNSKGLFNVPYNNKKGGSSYIKDNINSVSTFFNSVDSKGNLSILLGDFEKAVENVELDDFVFFDSPYAPIKADSFESYTKEGFSYEDHLRLANLFKKLSNKGVRCMLTNHNTELIRELYQDYYVEVVSVKRMINSDASKRNGEEVIVTNYPTAYVKDILKNESSL